MINLDGILHYNLIKTTRRLTFDIVYQMESTKFTGEDDGDYFMFIASNGYQVISRSRMDIQTERIWLLGAKKDESSIRSGTMIFSSDEKRDEAYVQFTKALKEWSAHILRPHQKRLRLSDYVNQPKLKAAAWKANGHFVADIVTECRELADEHAKMFGGEVKTLYELE